MINTDIKLKNQDIEFPARWVCCECLTMGRRVCYEDMNYQLVDNAVSAHKAYHRLNKEQIENQEREGMDYCRINHGGRRIGLKY